MTCTCVALHPRGPKEQRTISQGDFGDSDSGWLLFSRPLPPASTHLSSVWIGLKCGVLDSFGIPWSYIRPGYWAASWPSAANAPPVGCGNHMKSPTNYMTNPPWCSFPNWKALGPNQLVLLISRSTCCSIWRLRISARSRPREALRSVWCNASKSFRRNAALVASVLLYLQEKQGSSRLLSKTLSQSFSTACTQVMRKHPHSSPLPDPSKACLRGQVFGWICQGHLSQWYERVHQRMQLPHSLASRWTCGRWFSAPLEELLSQRWCS